MKHRFSSLLVAGGFIAGSVFGSAAGALGATVLGSSYFTDVPSGSYYDKAVGEMYSDGVIKGNPDGTFRPGDFVTRADVAVMFQRFKDSLDGTTVTRSSSSRSSASSTSNTSSSSSSSSYSYNPKGTIRFTTNAFSANETIGNYTITVVRTGGGDGSTTVDYAVTAGSATAGSDFEVVSGTLSFANKETSKTFTVKVLDDSTSEGSETATITLSNPTNGVSLGSPSTATLTILDNESSSGTSSSASSGGGVASSSSSNPNGTFSFGATVYGVRENVGTATITVNRAAGTTGTVGVNYATANGSATAGSDYSATSGTLTFSPGETSKTFTVGIVDDTSVDGAKSFNISLSGQTGGANIGNGSTTVTIYDNEDSAVFGSGSFKLAKAAYTVLESDKKVDITIQRTGGTQGTVSVEYRTTNNTAVSGGDFTHTTGILTFLNGEASKIISIPIVDDSSSEGEDTFNFDLFNPSSSTTLLTPMSAVITIVD